MYLERLTELRKSKNWTIEDVAERIDMGTSTYGAYETEYRKPPMEVLMNIARLYDVSIDYVLRLTDDKDVKSVERNAYEYLKKLI